MKNIYLISIVENIVHSNLNITIFDRKISKSEYSDCYEVKISGIRDSIFYKGTVTASSFGTLFGTLECTESDEKIVFSFGYEGFKLLVG